MPTFFKDSLDRRIAGDTVDPLGSLVQVETNSPSNSLLESRGVHLETSQFAPRLTFDDVGTLGANQNGILVQNAASALGTVMVEQQVLNNGTQLISVQVDSGTDTPPPPPPVENTSLDDFTAAVNAQTAAGTLGYDPVTGTFFQISQPVQETAPPPPPPAADDAGAPEIPPANPPGSIGQEQLPPDGCETTTELNFDQNGNVQGIIVTHFDGSGFGSVV